MSSLRGNSGPRHRALVALMLLIVSSIGWAFEIGPPDTSSPRATFESFLELSHELAERYAAYQADPNRDTLRALINQVDRGQHLMDLSQVAPAGQREVASQALGLLLDVVARVELPRLEDIPDARAYADGIAKGWPLFLSQH
jgi:MscS family membrane protein